MKQRTNSIHQAANGGLVLPSYTGKKAALPSIWIRLFTSTFLCETYVYTYNEQG